MHFNLSEPIYSDMAAELKVWLRAKRWNLEESGAFVKLWLNFEKIEPPLSALASVITQCRSTLEL